MKLFGIHFETWQIASTVIAIATLIHIRYEAKKIGENWQHLILPTIFFWWLVYPLWLFLWPGMHRPSRRGKDPSTYLPHTWARQRLEEKKNGSPEVAHTGDHGSCYSGKNMKS